MIYCVDDHQSIQKIVVYTLNSMGFEAEGFYDSVSLYKAIDQRLPSLIILDIMLPNEDGIAILSSLRKNKKTRDIPIIMATANGKEYDKIEALDLGADDYLVKPFGMMEMVSRVKAVLRRCNGPKDQESVTYSNLTMNIKSRSVYVGDEKIDLTLKEFDLLKLLISRQETVFSREDLLNLVWGMDYIGETRTVDVHIKTLRKKLGEVGSNIKTVRGIGYLMEKI